MNKKDAVAELEDSLARLVFAQKLADQTRGLEAGGGRRGHTDGKSSDSKINSANIHFNHSINHLDAARGCI